MSRKRAITTFLSRKFMITRLSIAFEDFPGSSIASQVMPPCRLNWVFYWLTNSIFATYNCLLAGTEKSHFWTRDRILWIGGGQGGHNFQDCGGWRVNALSSSHQHSAERVISWMGFLLNKRRLSLSACPCSISSRTKSSSNHLMVMLYLQINVGFELFWLFHQFVLVRTLKTSKRPLMNSLDRKR